MSRKIRFAFLGCGRISTRHVEALLTSQHAQLSAICDINPERRDQLAQLGKVPGYLNYHEMLTRHPEIDVVTIMTPSGMHFEHATDIIERYQKHIILEKPMVLIPEQGHSLQKLAQSKGVKLFPVYQNRFNKAVQKVKNSLGKNSVLGSVRLGTVRLRWCRPDRYYNLSKWRGTWAMDGGAMTNQGIHYIDLLRYICGEVKQVHTKTATLGAQIKVEDTSVSILEFESGALGIIEILTSARHDDYEASISVIGSQGLAVIGGIATNELVTFSPNPNECSLSSEIFPTVYGFGHNYLLDGVAKSILFQEPALIAFDDALKSIELLHALYESDEKNHWVQVQKSSRSSRLGVRDPNLEKLYRTEPPAHDQVGP